jgi:cell division protease FtsH
MASFFSRIVVLLLLLSEACSFSRVSPSTSTVHNSDTKSDLYIRKLENIGKRSRKQRGRYSKDWTFGISKTRDSAAPILNIQVQIRNSSLIPAQSDVRRTRPTSDSGLFCLEQSKYNFSDIGGYDDVKEELTQVVDFMRNTDKYKAYNVRLPKGVLLEGPPGVGKTLFAKCLAGEANLSFIATSGSQFHEKYVGVGASRIRELFEFARNQKPCLVFIDEIDAVARERSGDTESSSAERDQTLNQLLVEMDGFRPSDGVILIAATNRPDVLDEGVTRSGRIDKKVKIGVPNEKTRRAIFNIHSKGKPLNVSVDVFVELSSGLTGADIEGVLNEATLLAIRRDSLPVTEEDIQTVYDQLVIGRSSGASEMDIGTLWRIAVHEMGHVLASLRTQMMCRRVSVASPSSTTRGFTVFDEAGDSMFTRRFAEDKICVLLGGRIAEELVFGDDEVSSGCVQDLHNCREIVEGMVTQWGFGNSAVFPRYSQRSLALIDENIDSIIKTLYAKTKSLLREQLQDLIALSELLLEKKTLLRDDIDAFLIQTQHARARTRVRDTDNDNA